VEKHKVTIIEELEEKEGRIRKRKRKHKKREKNLPCCYLIFFFEEIVVT
jgi:hypothetical protein